MDRFVFTDGVSNKFDMILSKFALFHHNIDQMFVLTDEFSEKIALFVAKRNLFNDDFLDAVFAEFVYLSLQLCLSSFISFKMQSFVILPRPK